MSPIFDAALNSKKIRAVINENVKIMLPFSVVNNNPTRKQKLIVVIIRGVARIFLEVYAQFSKSPPPLRYRCSALPIELSSQLEAGHCVNSLYNDITIVTIVMIILRQD